MEAAPGLPDARHGAWLSVPRRGGYDARVTLGAFQPAGYCPHCGYRMDPGKCPECGRIVPVEELAKFDPIPRRRCLRVTTAAITALVCLVATVWIMSSTIAWIHHVPTQVLLRFQSQTRDRCTRELQRRFELDELSPTELRAFLRQSLSWTIESLDRSPHPRDCPVAVQATLDSTLSGYLVELSDVKVTVDGKPVKARHEYIVLVTSSGNSTQELFRLPRLASGQHDIMFAGDVSWVMGSPLPLPIAPLTIRRELSVTVADVAIDDIVQPLWNDELNTSAQSSVKAALAISDFKTGDDGVDCHTRLHLTIESDLPPLAGTFWLRCSDSGRWMYMAAIAERVDRPFVGSYAGFIPRVDFRCTNRPSVDVRFVPNGVLALEAGFDEYYGGRLNWTNLPVLAGLFTRHIDLEELNRAAQPPTSLDEFHESSLDDVLKTIDRSLRYRLHDRKVPARVPRRRDSRRGE